ncbi:MAG: hypothetical protein NZ949_04525 [Candidatus Kapabacteria bacterium]|nr:hypothetical protein [Candidatus Kapabacteria bacterium]
MKRWAVLDMGTNTFLLLIAEWQTQTNKLIILVDECTIPRLGTMLPQTGTISQEAVERAEAIASYYNHLCQAHRVAELWAIGTASFRNARNVEEAAAAILRHFHCPTTFSTLTPEQEAQYSFWGAVFPSFSAVPTLVLDIGGGSTEFIIGKGWEISAAGSLPLGAVWLWEMANQDGWDVETAYRFLNDFIASHQMVYFPQPPIRAYAVAGTPVTLAGLLMGIPYKRWWLTHGTSIARTDLEQLLPRLWRMPLRERRRLSAVHPKRADILPAGALILLVLMEYFDLPRVQTSVYGLRYGALLALLRRKQLDFQGIFELHDPRFTG